VLLGHQSNREILRPRFRTTKAKRAQARDQNRHLGGRPTHPWPCATKATVQIATINIRLRCLERKS
jgi:hypothetical protein